MKPIINKILLLFCIALFTSACKSEYPIKTVSEKRAVSEIFTKIQVQNGITAYISMDNQKDITVEADENQLVHIKTEIKDDILNIYTLHNNRDIKTKNVYISIDTISAITAKKGANIYSENTLLSEKIDLDSGGGCIVNLQLNTNHLQIKSRGGSEIKLKGRTESLEAKSHSGSSIEGYQLIATDVKAEVSSGAEIEITATGSIFGKASSGGSIKYKGKPKSTQKKTNSGGSVTAK